MVKQSSKQSVPKTETRYAGFWIRLFAFILDGIFLGLFGLLIGEVFYDFFVQFGPYGRFFGFPVAALYFGILNSSIGDGQTIGKRLMKIRVERIDGSLLTIWQSFARYTIFGIPYFLNGAAMPPALEANVVVGHALTFLVFGVGGAIVYLFVFNRPTRRSLHDLAMKTVVLRTDAAPGKVPELWRGHMGFAGAILLIGIGLPFLVSGLVKGELFEGLQNLRTNIITIPEVRTAGIKVGASSSTSFIDGETQTTSFIAVQAYLTQDIDDFDAFANRIARIVLDTFPEAVGKDRVLVVITVGYDIGIASRSVSHNYGYSPAEWRLRIIQPTGEEEKT